MVDSGQNTSDNLVFAAGKNDDDYPNHDGYVYGQSIIGADTWALILDNLLHDKIYDKQGNLVTCK